MRSVRLRRPIHDNQNQVALPVLSSLKRGDMSILSNLRGETYSIRLQFWEKHAQKYSEWWTHLPAEEKRRTLSMPVDEVTVTFQGKYDLRGAYLVVSFRCGFSTKLTKKALMLTTTSTIVSIEAQYFVMAFVAAARHAIVT